MENITSMKERAAQAVRVFLAFMLAITLIPVGATTALAAENQDSQDESLDVQESPEAQSTVQPQSEEMQTQALPGSVKGSVWLDANENGIKDPDEEVLTGIKLLLCVDTQESAAVAETLTEADGSYAFSSVTPGTYFVKITDDTTYQFPVTYTSDNKIDETGFTEEILVADDQDVEEVDAGLLPEEDAVDEAEDLGAIEEPTINEAEEALDDGEFIDLQEDDDISAAMNVMDSSPVSPQADYTIDLADKTTWMSGGTGFTFVTSGTANYRKIVFDTTAAGHTYTIKNSPLAADNCQGIVFDYNANVDVIFENVTLSTSGNSMMSTTLPSPVYLRPGAVVNIELVGSNNLASTGTSAINGGAGLCVMDGASLTINGTGSLTAQGSSAGGAGIGACNGTSGSGYCGDITIGGDVTISANGGGYAESPGFGAGIGQAANGGIATSGSVHITDNANVTTSSTASGIGGGYLYPNSANARCGGTLSNVTIDGNAKVVATGGKWGGGIGSSVYHGPLGTINIGGNSDVDATGDIGIGGGYGWTTRTGAINITGGKVKATGAVGIGVLTKGMANNTIVTTISGGDVTAIVTPNITSYDNFQFAGAAIGGGRHTGGGTINISGGTINAIGASNPSGYSGAAIGAGGGNGFDTSCPTNINISGGTINATATEGAAIGLGNLDPNPLYSAQRTTIGNTVTVNLTGGTINAQSIDGAGVGSGDVGIGTKLNITPGVDLQAYSNSKVAIEPMSTNLGSSYYINDHWNPHPGASVSYEVERYYDGNKTTKLGSYTLPIGCYYFGFSTDETSATDYNLYVVDSTTKRKTANILRASDESKKVNSVNGKVALDVKLQALPQAGDPAAISVGKTDATFTSDNHSLGSSTLTQGGFKYSTSVDGSGNLSGTITTVPWTSPYTTSQMSEYVSNLSPNTHYYLTTYLDTDLGYDESAAVSFYTLPDISSASIAQGSNASECKISASFTIGGGLSIDAAKIYYDTGTVTTASPSVSLTKGSGTNQYQNSGFTNYLLTGLTPGTAYNIMVEIENEHGDKDTKYLVFSLGQVTVNYLDRDGTVLQTATTATALVGDIYTITSPPTFTNLLFVDWSYNGGALQGNTSPSITTTGNDTITLVYGKDRVGPGPNPPSIPDGVEDFDVRRHWISDDSTPLTLIASQTDMLNSGETFSKAHTVGVTQPTGYTYAGYLTDQDAPGTTPHSGAPSFTINTTDKDRDVYYVYTLNTYTVTVHYVDRNGIPVSANTTATVSHGSNYTGTAPGITNYLYVGSQLTAPSPLSRSTVTGGTAPNHGPITSNTDVYLVYGQDDNNNGTEDIRVTRQWGTLSSGTFTAIPSTTSDVQVVDIGSSFSMNEAAAPAPTAAQLLGWTYNGYTTSLAGTPASGTPTFTATVAAGNRSVYYVYQASQYTVTEHYVDRSGTQLSANTTKTVTHNGTYSGTATPISNYLYAGFQTTAPTPSSVSTVTGAPTPSYTPVTSNMDIYIVYGQDSNNNGTEDVNVTRHALGDDGTLNGVALTTNLTPVTKVVDLPATYTDAETGVAETGWTYAGWNVTGLPASYTAGAPSIVLVAGVNVDVTYVYTATPYTVTEHYVDRNGVSLSADTTATVTHGSYYTSTPTGITNYLYVGSQLTAPSPISRSTVTGGTAPNHGPITGNTDVYLVYGQDDNNNGTEDIRVTRQWGTLSAGTFTAIPSTTSDVQVVDIGTSFSMNESAAPAPTAAQLLGWTYNGYTTSLVGTPASGTPTFTATVAAGNRSVYYVYQASQYTVTEHYVDRSGTQLSANTTKTVTHNGTYTGAATTISNYLYAGFQTTAPTPSSVSTVTGAPTPSYTPVTGNMDIYIVYGQDSNNNGTEDVNVTRHALGDDGTLSGVALTTNLTPVTKVVDLPGTYTDAETGVAEPGWTYAGWNTNGDPATQTAGNPSITLVAGVNVDVYYVYTQTNYTVTYHLVDRTDTAVTGLTVPTAQTNLHYGDTFGPVTAPSGMSIQMTYVGFKIGLAGTFTTGNATGTVTGNMDVYLIYGQDKGDGNDTTPTPDGTEDVTITKKWESTGGTTLAPTQTVYRNVPGPFNEAHGGVSGWNYAGYRIDAGPMNTGNPNETLVGGVDFTITYLYTAGSNSITLKFEDRSGAQIKADEVDAANTSSVYAPSAAQLAVPNYMIVDWKLSTEMTWRGNTTPSETVPAGGFTMIMRYGQDRGNDNDVTPTPDGIEDVTITKKWESSTGTTLQPTQTVYRNIPGPFIEVGGSIAGWNYAGFKVDGGILTPGNPNIGLVGGTDHTVTYVYTGANQNITIHFEDRAGAQVKPDITTAAPTASTFAPISAQLAVPQYLVVDWKLSTDASWRGNTSPSATVPVGGYTMIVRYGQDKGNNNDTTPTPDGIEDVTITKKWESTTGVTLAAPQTVYRNIPGPFNEPGGPVAGYTYTGYKVNNGTLRTGIPNIALVGGVDRTITYIYAGTNQNITVKYVKNDGVTQLKGNTTLQAPTGSTFTLPASYNTQTVGGVLYKMNDWNQNSGPWAGNTSVSFTMPPTSVTITLKYFQDANDNGIEDFTITERHENGLGNQLKVDNKVIVDMNDPYNGTADAGLLAAGYTYERFNIDGSPWVLGPTLPSIANVTSDHNVVFSYLPNDYLINVEYRYKDGTLLDTHTQMITHTNNFTAPVKTYAGKVQTHWTLDGANQGNTAVKLTNVTRYHNIVVWFGQDSNNNGTEDFTITEDFYCNEGCGATFMSSQKVIVDKGNLYTSVTKKIAHHTYASYKVGNGAMKTGTPTIANVKANAQVSLYYNHASYTVKTTHVDSSGAHIGVGTHDASTSYKWLDSHTGTVPGISGYTFAYWTLDGVQQSSSVPQVSSVEKNHNIQVVYTPNATPPNPPDHGNYSFVKSPHVKTVSPGEHVDYTFTGFGNEWGKTITNYSIADKPDKGLDFISANLPAFTNGAGVAYDVIIHTDSNINGFVLHSQVPADQPFYFTAPSLAGGERITAVTLEFGDVPAGFGVGDSLTMTFRVWDNPPSRTLGNTGILSYMVDGVQKQFTSSGDGTQVTLGGYFGTPKTGDHTGLILLSFGLVALVSGGTLLGIRRRNKRGDAQ